jgi:SAM-dependent methyltransferase
VSAGGQERYREGDEAAAFAYEWLPMLRALLAHPLTRGMDIDDPRTTALRREIIQAKPFLKRIYDEWYTQIAQTVPSGPGRVFELGSGAGFLEQFIPDVITSEIFETPGIDVVADGLRLPLGDDSLRGIVMVDVFHHLPRVRDFLREGARCVRAGGVISMIEPWVSGWSQWVYRNLHHEPFEPGSATWDFPMSGPLSGANGALPWIVFERDRQIFEREFPQWRIERILPMMPLRYLISGGVSMRSLVPGWSHGAWRALEGAVSPLNRKLAMFAQVVLRKV